MKRQPDSCWVDSVLAWLVFAILAFVVMGAIMSGCSYSAGKHSATTRVRPQAFYLAESGADGLRNVPPGKVRMQVSEAVDSTQTTSWREFGILTDRKSGVTTDRYGAIEQYSEAKQSDAQTDAIKRLGIHGFWSMAIVKMMADTWTAVGEAFGTWSDNQAAVDLEAIETQGEVDLMEAAD